MIELKTDRLIIRDHVPDDLATHHALFSSIKVMWYLQDLRTADLEASQKNLRKTIEQIDLPDRRLYFLRIELIGTHDHVGEIGYTVNTVTPKGKMVGVGYFIRDVYWGKGYTSEAFNEIIRFAFEDDQVYRISCGCLKENAASERVMQKCGMIKEAEFKEYQYHDGRLKDRVEYRLLRHEWESAHAQKTKFTT